MAPGVAQLLDPSGPFRRCEVAVARPLSPWEQVGLRRSARDLLLSWGRRSLCVCRRSHQTWLTNARNEDKVDGQRQIRFAAQPSARACTSPHLGGRFLPLESPHLIWGKQLMGTYTQMDRGPRRGRRNW